jgi:hypothetical protein
MCATDASRQSTSFLTNYPECGCRLCSILRIDGLLRWVQSAAPLSTCYILAQPLIAFRHGTRPDTDQWHEANGGKNSTFRLVKRHKSCVHFIS